MPGSPPIGVVFVTFCIIFDIIKGVPSLHLLSPPYYYHNYLYTMDCSYHHNYLLNIKRLSFFWVGDLECLPDVDKFFCKTLAWTVTGYNGLADITAINRSKPGFYLNVGINVDTACR